MHKLDFVRQISRLAGIGPFDFTEPYLEGLLRLFTRQQEEALDLLELKLQLEAEKLPEAVMKAATPAGNIDGLINGKLREFDGETTRRLTASLNGHRQQAVGVEQYRWRTQGDEKVRESHAHNANEVFLWDSPPPTGHNRKKPLKKLSGRSGEIRTPDPQHPMLMRYRAALRSESGLAAVICVYGYILMG